MSNFASLYAQFENTNETKYWRMKNLLVYLHILLYQRKKELEIVLCLKD